MIRNRPVQNKLARRESFTVNVRRFRGQTDLPGAGREYGSLSNTSQCSGLKSGLKRLTIPHLRFDQALRNNVIYFLCKNQLLLLLVMHN